MTDREREERTQMTGTTSAHPVTHMRRPVLLVLLLFVASLLTSGPVSQSPAFGLSDAGYVDALAVFSNGTYDQDQFLIDGASGRLLLGTTPGQSMFNPVTRRAYGPPIAVGSVNVMGSCYPAPLETRDVDSGQVLPATGLPGDACSTGPSYDVLPGRNEIFVPSCQTWSVIGASTYQVLRTMVNPYCYEGVAITEIADPVAIDPTRAAVFTVSHESLEFEPFPVPTPIKVRKADLISMAFVREATITTTSVCSAAHNYATNRLYVTNEEPGQVIVLDGDTLTEVARVDVSPYLGQKWRGFGTQSICGIAVNPATNKIYLLRVEGPQVAKSGDPFTDGNLHMVVIDGESNQVVSDVEIGDQSIPSKNIAVDPATSKIYVGAPDFSTNNLRRAKVFVDATPDTIQATQQTGRHTQWFFAEGTTRQGFRTFLTLYSPDVPNRVRIEYLTGPGQGGPFFQEIDLPANTRITVEAGSIVGSGKDISTRITSLYDKPFFAERPMYFDSSAGLGGGGTTGSGQHN